MQPLGCAVGGVKPLGFLSQGLSPSTSCLKPGSPSHWSRSSSRLLGFHGTIKSKLGQRITKLVQCLLWPRLGLPHLSLALTSCPTLSCLEAGLKTSHGFRPVAAASTAKGTTVFREKVHGALSNVCEVRFLQGPPKPRVSVASALLLGSLCGT